MASLKPAFIPAAEVFKEKEDALLAEREMADVDSPTLVGYCRDIVASAKRARLEVDQKLLSIRRRLNGIIDPDKLAALRSAGMPEDYFRLTARKARDVEGWVGDVFNPYQERTWDIVPQNYPELPPEKQAEIEQGVAKAMLFANPQVQQLMIQAQQTGQPLDLNAVRSVAQDAAFQGSVRDEADKQKEAVETKARQFAEERCTKLEQKMQDILHESGYFNALAECFKDLSELKSCILKGPILRKERVVDTWEGDTPVITEKVVRKFYRVNPFDYYPCANSKNPQDGPTCELEHFKPSDLQKMIGVPGYNSDTLKKIIRENKTGHRETTTSGSEQFRIEKQNPSGGYTDTISANIDSWDIWADIPGEMLLKFGMDGSDILDPDISYPCNIKMVGNDVYRAVINPDPLGEKPYQVTSFVKSNDSQWGTAPAELGASVENFCMNTLRNLVRNIGESAGAMADVNIDRLAEGETPDRWPGKTFLTTSRGMATGKAVEYYQANLLGNELWNLFEKAKLELDYIIVPSFGSGSVNNGGGRAASGLAMIMNSESRNLKIVVANIDHDIQIPAVERVFRSIMLFDDDMELKGGLKLRARGIGALLVKEGLVSRQGEFLKNTLNPIDNAIIGTAGRAYMLKGLVKDLGWDTSQALPNYEQIEKKATEPAPPNPQQQQQAGAEGAMLPGPAKLDASGTPMADYHQ